MATKTKTKTDTKKSESKTTKADTAKTETKSSETSTASNEAGGETANDTTTSGGGKASTSSRPISYFSSVSTDDYRSGWDGVFGNGAANTKSKPAKRPAKASSKLPMTMTLDAEDLEPEVRDQLEAIFRKQAKKKRLNYDKLSGNGQVSLQVSCRISNA